MNRWVRGPLIAASGAALAACAGALTWNPYSAPAPAQTSAVGEPIPGRYVVQAGDTLYSIAWRYGLDYRDVATWNGIGSSYLIKPGQTLVLAAPQRVVAMRAPTRPAAPSSATAAATDFAPPAGPLNWVWPTSGAVVRLFHAGDPLSKGIDISGAQGQPVYAAAPGKVVYSGSGITGYGKLIIIKNSEQVLSAYADNNSMLVREGDAVQSGERIATMGLDRNGHPLLHFEIRYNGKPVNPLAYLPSRGHLRSAP
ncbi:MAG: peptidoglycan DD-metalloendopeptidase family protein [Gammaproteobacteria bacterium]|nr:peptidoglycan DD-metalloendopeptidase family protein [Gammaproteobacteria bacterium]MDE2023239.1 peptidoglycan DD-metalloendopeptidase family protein [Gammaproteobacteria bacterium]